MEKEWHRWSGMHRRKGKATGDAVVKAAQSLWFDRWVASGKAEKYLEPYGCVSCPRQEGCKEIAQLLITGFGAWVGDIAVWN